MLEISKDQQSMLTIFGQHFSIVKHNFMEFSVDCFKEEFPGVDPQSLNWVTIEPNSRLFRVMSPYIAANLVKESSKSRSYEFKVLPVRDKEEQENSNKQGTQGPVIDMENDRIAVNIGLGSFTFRALNRDVLYAIHQSHGAPVGLNHSASVMKSLVILTTSSVENLAQFTSDLLNLNEESEEGIFTCYNWSIGCEEWREDASVEARPLSSVVLPSATKDRLISDLKKFLSPTTRAFYKRNGIPYRRSYLFYGLPGTGKTSMVQALAGRFDRNVCYLMPTHPKMTDDSLREAISELPSDSICVFEDIDSLFAKDRSNKVSQSSLTFSGLLNALDGVGDSNGQIFVLTTNLREQLDPALIRNGRVDIQIEFTYATVEQMALMWRNFYPEDEASADTFAAAVDTLLAEHGLRVTTSNLQHFFISQMDATPLEALANISKIIDELRLNDAEATANTIAANPAEGADTTMAIRKADKAKRRRKRSKTAKDADTPATAATPAIESLVSRTLSAA